MAASLIVMDMNIDGSRLEETIVNYLSATKLEVEEEKRRLP